MPHIAILLHLQCLFLQVCQFILWPIQRSFRFKSKIWRQEDVWNWHQRYYFHLINNLFSWHLHVCFLFILKLSDEPSQLQRSPHRNCSRWGRRSWHSSSNDPALYITVACYEDGMFMCWSKTMVLIWQVKPGLPYLDVIRLLRDNSALPIAAYQVSSLCNQVYCAIVASALYYI
jgi:hypothetical protein